MTVLYIEKISATGVVSWVMLIACTSWLIRLSGARLSVSMDGSPLNISMSEPFLCLCMNNLMNE